MKRICNLNILFYELLKFDKFLAHLFSNFFWKLNVSKLFHIETGDFLGVRFFIVVLLKCCPCFVASLFKLGKIFTKMIYFFQIFPNYGVTYIKIVNIEIYYFNIEHVFSYLKNFKLVNLANESFVVSCSSIAYNQKFYYQSTVRHILRNTMYVISSILYILWCIT